MKSILLIIALVAGISLSAQEAPKTTKTKKANSKFERVERNTASAKKATVKRANPKFNKRR